MAILKKDEIRLYSLSLLVLYLDMANTTIAQSTRTVRNALKSESLRINVVKVTHRDGVVIVTVRCKSVTLGDLNTVRKLAMTIDHDLAIKFSQDCQDYLEKCMSKLYPVTDPRRVSATVGSYTVKRDGTILDYDYRNRGNINELNDDVRALFWGIFSLRKMGKRPMIRIDY